MTHLADIWVPEPQNNSKNNCTIFFYIALQRRMLILEWDWSEDPMLISPLG